MLYHVVLFEQIPSLYLVFIYSLTVLVKELWGKTTYVKRSLESITLNIVQLKSLYISIWLLYVFKDLPNLTQKSLSLIFQTYDSLLHHINIKYSKHLLLLAGNFYINYLEEKNM